MHARVVALSWRPMAPRAWQGVTGQRTAYSYCCVQLGAWAVWLSGGVGSMVATWHTHVAVLRACGVKEGVERLMW